MKRTHHPDNGHVVPLFPELDQPPPAFTFIDLFAGIGGIRKGMEQAGGRCLYTVEFDRFAMKTYSANFPSELPPERRPEEPPRDIHKVTVADIPRSFDVLAAGFPCQPFSIAGVSKKLSLGREHGFKDEKSGNLFEVMARLVQKMDNPPPVLFLENVKHLVRHDKGRTFRTIRRYLKVLGYNVSYSVVDAQPWVPQHRERTFIIGLHRDTYGDKTFAFPAHRPPKPWPKMESILEPGPVEEKYTLTPHLWQYLQAYAAKHKAAGNGFGYGLVDRDGVSRTLSARYYKDGSEVLIKQKDRPRRLTPRECSRLMGYPADFIIPVSDTQAYKQFGNSVVVPVVGFLAQELVRQGILPVPSESHRKDWEPAAAEAVV